MFPPLRFRYVATKAIPTSQRLAACAQSSHKSTGGRLPRGVCLNVNIPEGEVKGIKIATQTQGKWVNEYYKMQDETGHDIFRMTGNFENWEDNNHNSDEWALANGYAAIVPVKIDMTAHDFIPHLQNGNSKKYVRSKIQQ